MTFYVGQKVCCIKNSVQRINDRGFPGFTKGEVLTVAGLHNTNDYGLFLSFVERNRLSWGHHKGFRPVVERKTDISILERLLDPSNHEKELETIGD
jgi:hypothetical protein